MKNLYRVLSIPYVMLVLFCFIQDGTAQIPTNQWNRSKINKYFSDRAKSLGVEQSSLKGADGKINSFDDQYCSDFGVIDITPDTWDPSTTTITWTIQTFVGAPEFHPDWADVVGTGNATVLKFYPDRVTPEYFGAPIWFEYIQRNSLGFIVDTKFDYTTVYLRPTAFDVSGNTEVCIGNSAMVTLSNSEAGVEYTLKRVSDDAPVGFTITGASGGGSINFPLTPLAVGATDYYVEAINPNNNSCSSIMNGTATVTVHPLPVPTAGNDGPVCEGGTINLSGGPAGITYAWTGPNGFTSNLQNPVLSNVSMADAGVYMLTVTDGNTCEQSTNTTVTINANPSITAGSNSPVCEGSAINLTSSPAGGSGTYTAFNWTGPNGFTASTQNPTVANATLAASGDYTVTVTDNLGCSSTLAATETVLVTER
ncbi:hypothetical protein SAMN06265379_101881, partial [Saccharicrinis carchari]